MYQRRHSYDSIRELLKLFTQTIPKPNNELVKASAVDIADRMPHFEKFFELNKEKEEVGQAIYNQFKDLRNDYNIGKINLKRYQEHLQAYKDFFAGDVSVKDLPKSINALDILLEINKHVGETQHY